MERNITTTAVVLKTRRFGEFHKSVTLLCPEKGIIEAVAHGAYKGKSRLGSITEPFCVSDYKLYYNPVKDSWKIDSCESVELNSTIKENLNAVYNASFYSELMIKTHGSGADWEFSYNLLTDTLRTLNKNWRNARALTTHFVYRFLINSGFIGDITECGNCGCELDGKSIYYSVSEGCFLCKNCASSAAIEISSDAVRYLTLSLDSNLEEAVKNRLDLETEYSIRNILLDVLERIINIPLNTLEYIDYGLE